MFTEPPRLWEPQLYKSWHLFTNSANNTLLRGSRGPEGEQMNGQREPDVKSNGTGLSVTLYTHAVEALGSSLGRDTCYPDWIL
jgi:hypothetical protein